MTDSNKQSLKTLIGVTCLAGLIYFTFIKHPETPKADLKDYPKVIPITTSLTASQKTLATEPDVTLTQTYKAIVNGKEITAPIKTVPGGLEGSKQGVIKQEVDLTPVMKAIEENAKAKYKVNWEAGIGLGVHQGNAYVPIELQRNFSKDHAVAIEVHVKPEMDVKGLKVNGGEIKYKVLFK